MSINTPDGEAAVVRRLARVGIFDAPARAVAVSVAESVIHAMSDEDIAEVYGGTWQPHTLPHDHLYPA